MKLWVRAADSGVICPERFVTGPGGRHPRLYVTRSTGRKVGAGLTCSVNEHMKTMGYEIDRTYFILLRGASR